MARKISAVLLLTLFVFSLFAVSSFATKEYQEPTKVNVKRFPTHMTLEEASQYEQRVADRSEFSAMAVEDQTFVPNNTAAAPAAIKNYPIPAGGIYSGETTYDYQWNGGPHRSIEHGVDPLAIGGPRTYVHVVWMMLESYVLTDPNRNVHYNCYDWTIPGWTISTHSWGGMPLIEVGERGGYPHVDVNSTGNAIVFHHSAVDGATAYSRIARFSIPGQGIYTADRLTSLTGQQNIWARGAVGNNGTVDVYHVGAQDSNPAAGDAAWQAYWRFISPAGPWEGPVPMCQSLTLSHEFAADGNRVIFGYSRPRDLGVGRTQYNNDFLYFESLTSGADWLAEGGRDETDIANGLGFNVTDYVDSDPHRVYLDISLMFDWDGRLHAIYNTPAFDDAAGTISVGPTVLQHWDEGIPGSNGNAVVSGGVPGGFVGGQDAYHSICAAALWGSVPPDVGNSGSSGAWNRYITKMTLGIGDGSTACTDASTSNTNLGYLYATYTLFGGQAIADREDASTSGMQNGNIAISMSNDNGYSWAAPKVLTTVDGTLGGTPTRSPDCDCVTEDPSDPECATPCKSEHWSSMAKVVNDTIHVFYVADYDAGGIPQDEGNWAVNKLVYHPVIGDGVLDGNLCPTVAPVLSAVLTGSATCEYHGDLAPGRDPYQVETLSISNYGNADLDYTADITYLSGTDWMDIDGNQTISSTTISKGEPSETYVVTMDAVTAGDKGLYRAELNVNHNDPLQGDPFIIPINFFVADSFVCGTGTIMTTPRVALEVSNVESFARENGSGGMWYYADNDADSLYSPIYDGSLMIANKTATAAGPNTVVYRDMFSNSTPSNPGFRALEELKLSYNSATDESVGVANQVTVDSLIGVTVQYLFPQDVLNEEFIRIKYKVYNNTIFDPDLIVGVGADLDVGTTTENGVSNGDLGGYISNYNLVYQHGTEQDTLISPGDTLDVTTQYAAGITALTCAPAKRMVVQSNRNYVYPDGGFSDEYAYAELDSNGVTIWYDLGEDDQNGNDYVDDIHSIIAFPEVTLVEDPYDVDGAHVFHVGLVTSVQAQAGVEASVYHNVAPNYDGYVLNLINTTKKAWKKAFGWCGDFAVNAAFGEYPYKMGPDGELYLNATGTHENGLASCCGCVFTLISVVPTPAEGTITLVDDGGCHAHLQTTGTSEGSYTVTVQVADMCADQVDELTFDIEVAQTCYCGVPGNVDNVGAIPSPLDVTVLVKKVYKAQDALYDYYGLTGCPFQNGDLDGNGGQPSPLDVTLLVKKVYKSQDALCTDRCSGTPGNCPHVDP